ncbi:MAG: hypothetical protein D6814_16250, partial [Calditrichaeota bacterium]
MRRSFWLLYGLLLFMPALLWGQAADTVKVGIRTVDLAVDDEGMVVALSEGRDLDFDTVVDAEAGEMPGALFRIDPATHEVIAKRRFPGFIRNLAVAGRIGYFVQNAPLRLTRFDTHTLATLRDTLILAAPEHGIAFFEVNVDPKTGLLYIGTGGFSDAGEVLVFDSTGVLLHRAHTGFGASDVLFKDEDATASRAAFIINEGQFGQESATLSYLNIQQGLFRARTGRPLGDTGNGMALGPDGKLYIVMNGSHTIEVFDTKTQRAVGTVKMGTTGFNGPRQVALLPDSASGVVTTFNNDLRFFDLQTLQVTDSLAVGQKPEQMVAIGDYLFVANGGFTGFAEDSTIFVVDWRNKTIVDTLVTGIRTTHLVRGLTGNFLYALSEGRDLNFDGVLDEDAGEVPAAIFRIDATTHE